MKILKYLIYIIVSFAIIFILLGFIKPTVKYGHQITVTKSIQESWDVFQDHSKYDQWLKGFKSIELISGSRGEKGSKYKVVVNPEPGQPDFEMIETITSIKALDHIDLNFDSEMMIFDQKTTFKEENSGTIIKTESTVKGKGMMMKSMFAAMELLTGSFQKQEEQNIEALKKVIESN